MKSTDPRKQASLLEPTPFAALSFIAAPAVLTNAASVLALGTSNRFARAVDRARALAASIEAEKDTTGDTSIRIRQFERAQRRTMLLLSALRMFYTALGSFAAASIVAVIGAGLNGTPYPLAIAACAILALGAGLSGVICMVYGCSLLVRETRLAVDNLAEEAELLRARFPEME